MAYAAHSDWTFEHSPAHHLDTPVEPHADSFADATHLTEPDSVASVLKTLWHHTDLMSSGGKAAPPTLTVADNALTVNAGGSVALPISVAAARADQPASVTIAGLTGYESLTDNLDHQTFTGGSITLSAAQVNSGLSLASTYAAATGRQDWARTRTDEQHS